MVEAAVLGRALDRDEVGRLLDDADHRAIAPRVETDRARLVLGQVAALAAEADALLHLLDRGGESECLVLGHAQEVEGEPLSGPRPDPRQPRQLRYEVVDRRRQHPVIVPG